MKSRQFSHITNKSTFPSYPSFLCYALLLIMAKINVPQITGCTLQSVSLIVAWL